MLTQYRFGSLYVLTQYRLGTICPYSPSFWNDMSLLSIVLEAPIPKRSFGDKTSLYVTNIYSDKQQLSHKIGYLG